MNVRRNDVFVIYRVDLSTIPEWTGTIDRLRLDPTNASGALTQIDYIRFAGATAAPTYTPTDTKTNTPTSTPTLTPTPVLTNTPTSTPTDTPFPGISWEFNEDGNFEGWTANDQIANPIVQGGSLSGRSTGNDPILMSRSGLSLQCSSYEYIELRMRVSGAREIDLFFKSAQDVHYSEAKKYNAPVRAFDSYIVYGFQTHLNGAWSGTVDQLRLDPVNESGVYFDIDYIRIMEQVPDYVPTNTPTPTGLHYVVNILSTNPNYYTNPLIAGQSQQVEVCSSYWLGNSSTPEEVRLQLSLWDGLGGTLYTSPANALWANPTPQAHKGTVMALIPHNGPVTVRSRLYRPDMTTLLSEDWRQFAVVTVTPTNTPVPTPTPPTSEAENWQEYR